VSPRTGIYGVGHAGMIQPGSPMEEIETRSLTKFVLRREDI